MSEPFDELFPLIDQSIVRVALEGASLPIDPPWEDVWQVAGAVSEVVLEHHGGRTLFELFPGLGAVREHEFPWPLLSTRATNTLQREIGMTWSTIENWRVDELLALRNAGVLTVKSIANVAIALHLQAMATGFDPSLRSNPSIDAAASAFAAFVEWVAASRPGSELGAVFREMLGATVDVPDEWAALVAVRIEPNPVVEDAPTPEPEVQQDFAGLLGSLAERERVVLIERSRADRNVTLEELGQMHGVTREWIRQIEKSARSRVDELLRLEAFRDLSTEFSAFAERVGVAAPLAGDALEAYRSLLSVTGIDDSSPELGLVLEIAGPYSRLDQWLVHDRWDPDRAEETVQSLLARGPFSNTEAIAAFATLDVVPEAALGLLQVHPDVRALSDEIWIPWVGTVSDKAATILTMVLEPLTAEELVERIGENHAVRSARNAFALDERFVRVDRDRWGLIEWGLPEYEGVANELAKLIEAAGGEVRMADAVDALAGIATESSIRSYAVAPRFVQEAGMIRLRKNEPYLVARGLTRAKGLFGLRSKRMVGWLLPVDHDVLRGSGRVAPASVGSELGVLPTVERAWSHASGVEIRLSWRNLNSQQPQLSTIRDLAHALGAVAGDRILLLLPLDDAPMSALRLADGDNDLLTRLADLLDMSPQALALDLAAGFDVSLEAAVDVFVRREDDDFAEWFRGLIS